METVPPSKQHPGAALLSPQTLASSGLVSPEPFCASNKGSLMSPPGSRYAFEGEGNRPMSPILDVTNGIMANFNNISIQRPLSAQDFSAVADGFDFNRSFNSQGGVPGLDVPERPLSSMEIDSMTFKNDVANLVSWMNTLNSNQHRTVIDNLLSNLPDDVLSYTKSKLDMFRFHETSSPMPMYQVMKEPVTLDSVLAGNQPWSPANKQGAQRTLSPGQFDMLQDNRPRSADPYSKMNRFVQEQDLRTQNQENRTALAQPQPRYEKNPFNITNLAQQLTQTHVSMNDYGNSNAALKLSALSTINSRAQLESQRKKLPVERGRAAYYVLDEYNRNSSSSVPPPQRVNYYDSINQQQRPPKQKHDLVHTPQKGMNNPHANLTSPQPKSPAVNPKQITNPKLLNDIPAWLKTLRLHKYTQALQGIPWKELIYLTDEQLEGKGVSAMGARGKLLKAFDIVRQYYEDGLINERSD
jgi:hypothetical protein